jgi:chromosome segregation ATPase
MIDDMKFFSDIKKSTLEIEKEIKTQSHELANSTKDQKEKLKDLHDEKIVFDRNQVQLQIIKNQQLLIDEYKNKYTRLRYDLEELQKKIKELDEVNKKIRFYQDDNIRLSSEMNDIQKKYDIIKDNFNKTEKEKNDIFKQIQELNNSLLKNNIVGSPFLKEKVEEDSINSKILNNITENNLKDTKISDVDKDLNVLVNDIFK